MGFTIGGYWNIYGCVNKETHKMNVSFSIGQDCDQEENPCCPICGSNENVEFIDTQFLDD
jgi:hypothetical protein